MSHAQHLPECLPACLPTRLPACLYACAHSDLSRYSACSYLELPVSTTHSIGECTEPCCAPSRLDLLPGICRSNVFITLSPHLFPYPPLLQSVL